MKIGTSLATRWLTSTFQSKGHGFDLWSGTKIPHACAVQQEKKKEEVKESEKIVHRDISFKKFQGNEIVAKEESVLGNGFFISLRRKK